MINFILSDPGTIIIAVFLLIFAVGSIVDEIVKYIRSEKKLKKLKETLNKGWS